MPRLDGAAGGLDVRELTPEAIGGQVDLAFIGALLLHLRDPFGALETFTARSDRAAG